MDQLNPNNLNTTLNNPGKPPAAPAGGDPNDLSFQVMPQDGRGSSSFAKLQPRLSEPPPLQAHASPAPARSRRWLPILLIIILILAAGAAAYFILGTKKSAAPADQTSSKLPTAWLQEYFQKSVCDDQSTCGDAADPDQDGLTNYDEFVAGTSPMMADTDGDGIADGDEVNIYKTEPKLKFTDRRQIVQDNNWTDGVQISNGYDPLTPGIKFTDAREQQIASDTAKYGLHSPTTATLQAVPAAAPNQTGSSDTTIPDATAPVTPSTPNQ